ncbi:hypothetical protein GCM10020000_25960 [Streptomyces olivoverticillatus]
MARLTARKRKLTIAAASVLALAGVISGTVAMATQDSGGAPGHARGPSPDGRVSTPGIPSASVSRGPVSPEISHDAEDPGKVVNLTIDDGPDPVWTPKVLDVLKKYGAKATFCMIGPQAKARPDLVKKVLAASHRLCDHSVDHNTAMDKRSEDYQRQQILDAQKMIEDAAGRASRCSTTGPPRRRVHPLQPQARRGPRHAAARLERRHPRLAAPRHGAHRGNGRKRNCAKAPPSSSTTAAATAVRRSRLWRKPCRG